MDINMPIMDGAEATHKLTKMIKAKKIYPFKILITTTLDQERDRQNFFNLGAHDLIPKPITLHELVRSLTKISYLK